MSQAKGTVPYKTVLISDANCKPPTLLTNWVQIQGTHHHSSSVIL